MNTSPNMLSAEEVKEKQILDLKIVSPLHIGTREGRLTALEYVFAEGRTHIIDEDSFGRFLRSRGLIDQFVQSVGAGRFNMEAFLRNHAKTGLKEVIPYVSSFSMEGGGPGMNDFRPFVRDGNGQIFIPGTSLKGVLRTGLLYGMLKADKPLKDRVEKKAHDQLHLLRSGREYMKKSYSEKWLQEDLLQRFKLPSGKAGPNQDLLRCLTVRDAYPVATVQTQVVKIQFLSKGSGGPHYWSSKKRGGRDSDSPLELWLEAVLSGIFRTELIWDRRVFEQFRKNDPRENWPASSLDDLMKMALNMSTDLFGHEKRFYSAREGGTQKAGDAIDASRFLERWYGTGQGQCVRLGFGSGMLSTTVNLTFSEKMRQEIRNVCGHPRGDDPAPKSRRIWKGPNDQWRPLGWMQVGPRDTMIPDGDESIQQKPVAEVPQPSPTPRTPLKRTGRLPPQEEKAKIGALLGQLASVEVHNKLAVERIVNALEDLEDEAEARRLAEALRDKFKRAGIWHKHPLKGEIEMFLGGDE